jgi:arsenate reductase (glutaredoxin)
VDTFTIVVSVGMVLLIVWVIALGIWHPKTGAEILDWKPTRSPEVEFQNDLDDVAQMIAAQNQLRARRGKTDRSHAEVAAQVARDQRELADYADAYWAEQRERRAASGDDLGLVVYELPTCSNCRRLARLLTERGIDFERVDYHIDPLPAERIRELLAKAGIRARDALRLKEPGAAELAAAGDDEAIVAAMAANPVLLQRPIVERGDRAVLARPAERVLELL